MRRVDPRTPSPTATSGGPVEPARPTTVDLCGVEVTRMTREEFLGLVHARFSERSTRPLQVGSVNLDHLHHFGRRGRGCRREARAGALAPRPHWLLLADGAPISRRAAALSGDHWPRLTGADLLAPMLDLALASGASVGFLGGTPESVAALRLRLEAQWPGLRVAGCWTPPRSELVDLAGSERIAAEISGAGTDLLVVGLGKPLQEQWIESHGAATGARVMAAFGGAADFLGGVSRRAPAWVQDRGFEWLFRLATEPRRLSRRYLVQGPPAMLHLVTQRPGTALATRIRPTRIRPGKGER